MRLTGSVGRMQGEVEIMHISELQINQMSGNKTFTKKKPLSQSMKQAEKNKSHKIRT